MVDAPCVIGLPINVAEKRGEVWRCTPNVPLAELPGLQPGTAINRNGDHAWELALTKKSAERRVAVDLDLAETDDGFTLRLVDEEGISATAALKAEKSPATQPDKVDASLRENLGKLGTTIFAARNITLALSQPWFLPASSVNALRREAVAALEAARNAAYQRPARKPAVEPPTPYPEESLSYLANIYNDAARQFYAKHGVKLMDAAFEAHEEDGEVSLMVTKHCLRFSFNLCPKQAKGVTGVRTKVAPMQLVHGDEVLTLKFDCKPCEMHVIGKMKGHILDLPQPGSAATQVVGHISPDDLLKTIRQKPGYSH